MRFRSHTSITAAIAIAATTAIGGLALGTQPASAAAVLGITATSPASTLPLGGTFTSTLSITNSGDLDSAASVVTVSLPRPASGSAAATIGRVFTAAAGIVCSTYTPRYGSTQKRCALTPIAPGATRIIATYKVTSPLSIPFVGVSASYSATITAGPSASAMMTFVGSGPADLTANLVYANPQTVFSFGAVTFNGSAVNNGYSSTGAFHWTVDLPAGATSVVLNPTDALTVCTVSGTSIACDTSNVANGATLSFSGGFVAPQVGVLPISLSLDTLNTVTESNETNNQVSSTLTVLNAAVEFALSRQQVPSVDRGTVFTRSFTVTNNGDVDAQTVSLINRSVQFRFVSSSDNCHAYVTYSGRPSTAHYQGVTCLLNTVPAHTAITVAYLLTVPTTVVLGAAADVLTLSATSFQTPTSVTTLTSSTTVTNPVGGVAPTNLTLPAVTGNAVVGTSLTTTNGTWIGTATITYAAQWLRCDGAGNNCVGIAGATASSYLVTAADLNSTIRSQIAATNGAGTTNAASTATSVVIGAAAPVNTGAPTLIPGLESQPTFAWSISPGTWSGTPVISFTYQWQRCDLAGTVCNDTAGATSSVYVLQDADVFSTVRVRVTATNSGGSTIAYSNVSPEIDPLG